ncbi:sugar phosphorylase [Fredinandcohnia sp. 179-A 10B2 NHS]|uniref:sugar phosphorylase n=1 Tax=Fredinandcohnia sp. 179-A 10B2 NHS TaxID=3235176 RepID=UPI0039A18655
MNKHSQLLEKLAFVYGEQKANLILDQIGNLKDKYANEDAPKKTWVDETDVMLITYGDSIKEEGKAPLQSLDDFLVTHAKEEISAVHILPFYPYSSDDGFSVIDYKEVNPELGNWEDVKNLSNHFDLMFDGVINHISQHSEWFQQYLKGNPDYENYFIEADPNADYSKVTRPRALPLLTKFETSKGTKYIWTTFSEDQIDLNFENEKVFLEILELLMMYAKTGARFIRLDAIGFMWKKLGTSCIHLEETHTIIQIYREVLDEVVPGTILITETNVPHKDNISYFGNGYNEAQMVYQFPLPPLTLFTFHNANSTELSKWADSLEPTSEQTTFFNFLASHDGIGVRPVEGILTTEEVQAMADKVIENGGFVSYKDNGDGTKSPYELNINYLEAISNSNDTQNTKVARFIAAQSILLSVIGVPGIYVHSLLGSGNDLKGVEETGRYRSINREKLNKNVLEDELKNPNSLRSLIFNNYKEMISIRKSQKAFHPNAPQEVLFLDERIFAVKRTALDQQEEIYVLINVSNDTVTQKLEVQNATSVTDLVSNQTLEVSNGNTSIELAPYQVMWIKA